MKWIDRANLIFCRDLTLGELMARLADLRGEARLVEQAHGLRLTYREASARVDAMAKGIAAEASLGDRVVLATENGYDQFLLCVAVARAGMVAVPVNPQMRPDEVDYVEADSGAALVVHGAAEVLDVTGLFEPPPPPDPTAVAAIFYTSGTTGKPKGVRLTHRSIVGQVAAATLWPSGLRRDEVVAALPVAHIMGFSLFVALACAGIPVYCLPRFKADVVLNAIERRRATIFVGVPAMYRLLLEAGAEKRDLSSVRVRVSGADVMPAELARRFQAMGAAVTLPIFHTSLGGASFVEGYGMVETGGGVVAKLSPPRLPMPVRLPKPIGDILGFPLPPNRLRVVGDDGKDVGFGGVGELWIKGPSILESYHGDEAATAAVRTEDGWLRSGDLVRRGPLGVVAFVGRAKDVIKSGGYSVYAVEIERSIEDHPDVLEAAAVGLADERLGEVPAVVVRVREGAGVTEEDLLAWGRDHLASYKAPRAARIVDDLPRTGTDKVAKQRLVPLFAA